MMPHRAVRGEGDEGGVVVDEHGVGDGVVAQCGCYARVISRSVRNLLKMRRQVNHNGNWSKQYFKCLLNFELENK